MSFKHTEQLKDIKAEQLRAIEDVLIDVRNYLFNIDEINKFLNGAITYYKENKDFLIKDDVETYKQLYEKNEKDKETKKIDKELYELRKNALKEMKEPSYWNKHYNDYINNITNIKETLSKDDSIIKSKEYESLAYYITNDKKTKEIKDIEKKLAILIENTIFNFHNLLDAFYLMYIIYQNSDLPFKDIVIKKAFNEISYNINELYETYYDIKADDEEEIKKEQLTLPLEYNDIATLTDTGLINKLAIIKLENNALFKEQIAKLDFNIDENTINNSEKKLEKLNELDRFILDTIVIDFYYKQGLTKFTNRQIAIQYCKEKGIEHITENVLKEIDKSILKLQNTRISLDYKSIQRLKKAKVKIGKNNPLIWLEETYIDVEGTKTKGYEIIRTPFYFTYAQEVNAPMITYNRKLLYNEIKGIDKNINNQNLRHYLIRRLAPTKNLDTNEIYISINDIYEVQNIYKDEYKTANALKQARKQARERAELILKEYKKEYNFTYHKDDLNKRIKGYVIKFRNRNL